MRVELYGQPIVNVEGGQPSRIGTEILFRMPGPSKEESVSPAQYLQATEHPMVMPWFMDATVMGSLLVGDGRSVTGKLFLNVCPETMTVESIFNAWLAGLRELCARRPAQSVVVEISERCSLPPLRLRRLLKAISSTGALLALDDYPDGSAGDALLHAWPWDYVKICAASCKRLGEAADAVIARVSAAHPSARIIGERFSLEQIGEKDMQENVSAFQSFELGLPEPLNLSPWEGGINDAFAQRAVAIC